MKFDSLVNLILEEDERPHYHLIIRLELENMPDSAKELIEFVEELANTIDMEIVYGPKAVHLPYPETEGWSCIAVITSSHISVHTWNKTEPPLMQLDIFSCSGFSKKKVEDFIKNKYNVLKTDDIFIDRTRAIEVKK
jgi:S-adenosylmethionine/arginine decarboxylase-like enzyme